QIESPDGARLQSQTQPFFTQLQRLFGSLTLGNVHHSADRTQRGALRVVKDVMTGFDPPHFSVIGPNYSIFNMPVRQFLFERPPDESFNGWQVFRVYTLAPILIPAAGFAGGEAINIQVFLRPDERVGAEVPINHPDAASMHCNVQPLFTHLQRALGLRSPSDISQRAGGVEWFAIRVVEESASIAYPDNISVRPHYPMLFIIKSRPYRPLPRLIYPWGVAGIN